MKRTVKSRAFFKQPAESNFLNLIKMKRVAAGIIICLAFSKCTWEKEPSKQGQLLTNETIKTLDSDKTYQNKLISVEGYPEFCSMATNIRVNSPAKVMIYTAPECKGKEIIKANIKTTNSTTFLGPKQRNCLLISKSSDLEDLKLITDDYKTLSAEKLKFSGTLVYEPGGYYIDSVTIHKLNP